MTRTKLLLAGLLAGAMAFGTACKTDKSATNTGADRTTTPTPDVGTGGAGHGDPDRSRQGVNPVPEEGTREMEPGVHEGTHEEPGTGGTGLEEGPIDETDNLGGETGTEPLNPGAPANEPTPDEDPLHDHESTPEPRH